ncbi:glycosyltransferase family 1 protein [Zasmidium cellare ATCC 36951]|uniref:sterol 3beta-glucosyltransferase n=1 Tax=Zasmidium cellare ATCC 36951 TaxID=1080233 RepID=A0A6A6D3D5_ZASCE|nr:glycosyltransferase family 1 protein [Zasmidium cellare ATCC 36951]KAF2173917.1 glycosyltransferase family 1 protein [Zasmidium cellare ATCC 36951]
MTSPEQPRRHSSSFKHRLQRREANVRERGRGTMDLPERFKVDDDGDGDDGTGVDNPNFAHQSMYGMIAAQSGGVNFPGWFQHDSGSESERDEDKSGASKISGDEKKLSEKGARPATSKDIRKDKPAVKKHGQGPSENKLVHSFLKPIKEKDASQHEDPMTQSQLLPPRDEQHSQEAEQPTPAQADTPVLDRKLQAMAMADVGTLDSANISKNEKEKEPGQTVKDKAKTSLTQTVATIFQFEEPEDVVAEYPCWYTKNVILQGFMYITTKHVCFYSYLHQKTNTVLKNGHIGKQSKHGYVYHQYWFVLKGDSFSYYRSSADPYFPLGMVDLRYAISADITTPEEGHEATDFTITTPDRVYYYRAEQPSSAKEWVKQLQKVIFRNHNDGDSVKLSLPMQNIADVEETNVIELADTIKLRVLAGDDTYAIDEYFFTFVKHGKDALKVLKGMIEGNSAKKGIAKDGSLSPVRQMRSSDTQLRSPARQGQEPARSTLSPLAAGGTASPQKSSRSGSSGGPDEHSKPPYPPNMLESSESFVTSSSTLDDSTDPDMSASQMLVDDGMFQRPTFSMQQYRGTFPDRTAEREESEESSRESSAERVRVQPPDKDRPQAHRNESGGSGRTIEAEPKNKTQPITIKAPGRLARGISMPLQHAKTVADVVRSSSKAVGSYLSSSPKTYISNFSEAFTGGKRYYTDSARLAPDDSIQDPDQEKEVAEHERRFRQHFALPETENLVAVFFCWLHKTIPTYGKIYIGTTNFCFRSLLYGVGTKVILPHTQISSVQKQSGFRWGYPGMVMIIKGHPELFFEFPTNDLRNDAEAAVRLILPDPSRQVAQSTILTPEERQNAVAAAAENDLLREARKEGFTDDDSQLPEHLRDPPPPILFGDPAKAKLEIKPKKSLRIVCLTIGSRGDVQPFIALCKGLIAEGHRPKIATHAEFRPWVEKHGIEFAEVAGDPAELMRICVENGMFTPSFIFEANSTYRSWLDLLCQTGWAACRDAEMIIESPVAMVGIHIAEALEVPYFRAFTMPWTRTTTYPHAFAAHSSKKGGMYNWATYTLFENVLWSWPSWQINHWRRKTLNLPSTSLGRLQVDQIPFLYNVSPSVFIPPLDFCDWHNVTGYWFLDEGEDYQPPEDLAKFIKKARDDGQKLVYIGFGSVVVSDARLLTQHIVEAVLKADVRCILSKGWSDRLNKDNANQIPIELPPSIFPVTSVPHDWLFKQIDAAVHHGGAGTTGASLRAGIPTLIKPFFGDQNFWASRVEDLRVGVHLRKVTTNQLGKALWVAVHDERMRTQAALLGEQIRAEQGVDTAIYALYSNLARAKDQIKKRNVAGEGAEDVEENWTFIDGDSLEDAPVTEEGEMPMQKHVVDEADESDVDEEMAAEEAEVENRKLREAGRKVV